MTATEKELRVENERLVKAFDHILASRNDEYNKAIQDCIYKIQSMHDLTLNKDYKFAYSLVIQMIQKQNHESKLPRKNPAVEKHYSEMTKEQKLAEIDDCLESISNIFRNLLKERMKLINQMMVKR